MYVDQEGTLRTEHTVRFLGLTVLRLHYKMERAGQSAQAPPAPSTDTRTVEPDIGGGP